MSPIEKINAEYSGSIKSLLGVIKDRLSDRGFPLGEITDETDDEFAYGFGINDCAAVQITIVDSCVREGTEGGMNFKLCLYNMGGVRVFHITPYQHTPEVWVPEVNEAAVDDRWKDFMGKVFSAMPTIIDKTVEMVK